MSVYQDDFLTPGMRPSFAASRKHRRHMPKSRMNARLRPQRKQRRTTLDANLGGFCERAIVDVLAMFTKTSPQRGFQNILESLREVKLALFLLFSLPQKLLFERKAQVGEVRLGFFFAPRGGAHGDGHAKNVLELFLCGLGENDVLADAERVVAHLVD